jgi:hypothetical protein
MPFAIDWGGVLVMACLYILFSMSFSPENFFLGVQLFFAKITPLYYNATDFVFSR